LAAVDATSPEFTRNPGDADFNLLVVRMDIDEPSGADDPAAVAEATMNG